MNRLQHMLLFPSNSLHMLSTDHWYPYRSGSGFWSQVRCRPHCTLSTSTTMSNLLYVINKIDTLKAEITTTCALNTTTILFIEIQLHRNTEIPVRRHILVIKYIRFITLYFYRKIGIIHKSSTKLDKGNVI